MRYSYDTQDAIPEPLRAEYTEVEGKFVLKVDELPEGFAIENVTGLKSALKKERENGRTLAERLAAIEGGGTEEMKKLSGKVNDLDTQTRKLRAELQAERLTNLTTEAIFEAKGNPALLRPVLEKRIKIDENGKPQVIDDTGQPLLNKAGEPVSVRDFVFALREIPTYQGAFSGSGASGAGTPHSSGKGGTGTVTKRRSEMTVAEKASYLKEHGTEKFMQLPV